MQRRVIIQFQLDIPNHRFLTHQTYRCVLYRFNGNVISGKELDLSAEHLAALLYIQHPLLAHRPTPEHIQELTERFGGRLPNWVKTQIMPTKETASQKLSPRGLVR